MILRDAELLEWAVDNVTPFDRELLNPASLDLRLGDTIKVPMFYWYIPGICDIAFVLGWRRWAASKQFQEHYLSPGSFVLCHSLETTEIPTDCAAILFSKSSIGRRGIEHLHAGYGDPGFIGQWTMELKNMAPWFNTLEAGQPLMQLVLEQMTGHAINPYDGKYQFQSGATEDR